MKSDNEKIKNQINNLIQSSNDAIDGFETAVENVNNDNLKAFFEKKKNQRVEFLEALKNEMNALGQEINDVGSVAGSVHRTWMDVKSLFSGNNEKSILEEVIKGEESFILNYKKILEDDYLPMSTTYLLRDQIEKMEKSMKAVTALENIEG